MTKGKLAAIKWALHKTRTFTLDTKKLIIYTDHWLLVNNLKNVKGENESVWIS